MIRIYKFNNRTILYGIISFKSYNFLHFQQSFSISTILHNNHNNIHNPVLEYIQNYKKLFLSIKNTIHINNRYKVVTIYSCYNVLLYLQSLGIYTLELKEPNITINNVNELFNEYYNLYSSVLTFKKDEISPEILNNIKSIYDKYNDINSYKINEINGDLSRQTLFFNYSPVYSKIYEILNNNNDLKQKQLDIEDFLQLAWVEVLNSQVDEFKKNKNLYNESFILLHKHIMEFNSCIDYLRNDRKVKKTSDLTFKPLYELDDNTISLIVFNNIIPILHLSEGEPRNNVLMKIGEQLFHRWALYKFENREDKSIKFKDFKLSLNISANEIGNLGDILLHYLIQNGNLIKLDIKKSKKSQEALIVPSEEGKKTFNKCFDLIGFKLPMIYPPNDWNVDQDGDYLMNNRYHFNDLIHQSVNNVTPTTIEDNKIYNQINYMSKISFRINKNILNTVLSLGIEKELYHYKLHDKTDQIEPKLTNIELSEIESFNSQYYQDKNILGIAQLYSNVEKFYFPLFFDWRGRLYTDTSYLTFQGNELAKSLLEFSEGVHIVNSNPNLLKNSLNWLKIYGANCFGNGSNEGLDKLSYIDRINWIDKHHSDIISLDPEFWTKADDKLLFLAFCYEYKGYHEDPKNFKSHLPIQLDATCNGIQYLSMISANSQLAQLVNLLPNTENESPFDLYSVALDLIKKSVNDLIKNKPLYNKLDSLNLDRKIVKRSIMTIPYNVTVSGINDQLKEFFNLEIQDGNALYIPKDKKHGTEYISGKDLYKLAEIIHGILYKTHPELQNIVKYFKEMIDLLVNLDLPVVWITPSGLKIKQKYAKKQSSRIRSGLYKGADYTIVIPTNKFDKVAQQGAFMPNLIHSMDGSTITLLVEKLNRLGYINIYTIHDCFATTVNNVLLINELVREAFCEIYADENFLHNLHNFFIEYIKGNYHIDEYFVEGPKGYLQIPELPQTGNFKNLTENIKRAIYLIN